MGKVGVALVLCAMLVGAGEGIQSSDSGAEVGGRTANDIFSGISTVRVVVAASEDLAKKGVTADFLRDTIELDCRRAGIDIAHTNLTESG